MWSAECPIEMKHSIECSLGMLFHRDFPSDFTVLETLSYYYEGSKIDNLVGVQVDKNVFDVFVSTAWHLFDSSCVSVMPKCIYNMEYMPGLFMEHNFLAGMTASFGYQDVFQFSCDLYYLCKISSIFSVPVLLIDHSCASSVSWGSVIRNKITWKVLFSSYQIADYPLFGFPFCVLSCGIIVSPQLYINTSFGVQYTDFFTLTAYLSKIYGTVSIRCYLSS